MPDVGMFACFLLYTCRGLQFLTKLIKGVNYMKERPTDCSFLHQCGQPRGWKDPQVWDRICPEAPVILGVLSCIFVGFHLKQVQV